MPISCEPEERNAPIMSDPFGEKICKALGIDPMLVRRIVIDAEVGEPLRVYAEMYGGKALLDLEFPADGVTIKVLNAAQGRASPVDTTAS